MNELDAMSARAEIHRAAKDVQPQPEIAELTKRYTEMAAVLAKFIPATEKRLAALENPKAAPKPTATNSDKTPAHDLDAILKRLRKLKPTKRATAVNCVKAMFQFNAPIDDQQANKILESLRKRGNLTIDANDKLQILNT